MAFVFPASPANNQVVYNNASGISYTFSNVTQTWTATGSFNIGGNTNFTIYNQNITTSLTLASGYNMLSVGPLNIANGSVVSIPTGSKWVVL